MASTIPSSITAHDFNILPAPATGGVTDQEIAVLSRFLVRSTDRTGGLPLLYPRRSLDESQTRGYTYAPLRGTSGFERSRKVLDALVAIAVCGDSQCLALSVSFGTTVRITIAQNAEIPPSTISQHLLNVWEKLRQLANMQRIIRQAYCLPDKLDLLGSSPKSAESHLAVTNPRNQQLKLLKEKLHVDIHKHCYMKSKQRIVKYLSPCAEFYKFYRHVRAMFDQALVLADIVYNLHKISQMIIEYKGKFDASGAPVDMDWYYLANTSSLLLQMYLDDKVNVKEISNDVMTVWRSRSVVMGNRDWRRFDLIRALEKTVNLATHIQQLVSFAYSPRLRGILERQLDVRPLRPPTVVLPEPSPEDIRAVVERAFNATTFAMTRRIDEAEQLQDIRTDELDLVTKTVLPSVSEHTVHAEYTLLLHHHSETHNHANPPPFQYIAVNKPACFSCWSAYQGYNQVTGRIFSLRGSHSKLYFPTSPTTDRFDDAVGTALRKYLYSRLVAHYSEHLYHIQDARTRMGDSSVASHVSTTDNRLQVDSADVAARRRVREAEEAEMDKGLE